MPFAISFMHMLHIDLKIQLSF